MQLDASWSLGKTHMLHGGLFFQHGKFGVDNLSQVFPADADDREVRNLQGEGQFGSGLRDGFAKTGHLPSYTQVNASLSQAWDFGGFLGKMEGRLSVLNVFDSVYELRDGIGVGAPQFGPRRTVYASVTKSF